MEIKLEIVDKINNISRDNEEKDKNNHFYNKNTNKNTGNNEKEDARESSSNIKKEIYNNHNTYNIYESRGFSRISNIYSIRNNDNKSNQFGTNSRGKDMGHYNDKQNNRNNLPSDANEELFITDVLDFMSERDVKETFEKYREFVLVKLIKDKVARKNKGVVFVKYKEAKSSFFAMLNAYKIKCKG